MSRKEFAQQAGLSQILVTFSFVPGATPTVIRDGNSDIVSSVVQTGTGHYTATLDRKLGKQVAGVACIEAADDTPTDITCQWRYIVADKQIKIYCLTGATLTEPEASTRVNFVGSFWTRTDIQEA